MAPMAVASGSAASFAAFKSGLRCNASVSYPPGRISVRPGKTAGLGAVRCSVGSDDLAKAELRASSVSALELLKTSAADSEFLFLCIDFLFFILKIFVFQFVRLRLYSSVIAFERQGKGHVENFLNFFIYVFFHSHDQNFSSNNWNFNKVPLELH